MADEMEVGNLSVRLELDDSSYKEGMDEAKSKLASFSDTAKSAVSAFANDFKARMDEVKNSSEKATGAFGKLGETIKGYVVGNMIYNGFGMITEGIKNAAAAGIGFDSNMQQNQIAFSSMLGSAKEAKDMLGQFATFAANTPFTMQQVESGAKQLLAFGFNAKEIIPDLTKLGDAASGLGLGTDGINRLVLALGQMKAHGTADGNDILQLTQAGIPAMKMLADAAGVSQAQMEKLVSKGAIPANQAIQVIMDGMEKRFPKMMDAQSKSFSGMMSTLSDNFSQVMGTVMKPLFDWMSSTALPKLISLTTEFSNEVKKGDWKGAFETFLPKSVVDGFATFGTIVKDVFTFLTDHGKEVIAIVAGIATGFAVFETIQATIRATTAVMAAFDAVMDANPISIVVLAVAGLVAVGVEVATHWKEVSNVLRETWNAIKNAVVSVWEAIVGFFKKYGLDILEAVTGPIGILVIEIAKHWGEIKQGLQDAWNAIVSVAKTVAGDVVRGIYDIFVAFPEKVIEIGKNIVEGIWKGISGAAGALMKNVTGFFGNVVGGIKKFLGIHSPSTVTAEIGKNMAQGVVVGMNAEQGNVSSAAQTLHDIAAKALASGIGGKGSKKKTGHSKSASTLAKEHAAEVKKAQHTAEEAAKQHTEAIKNELSKRKQALTTNLADYKKQMDDLGNALVSALQTKYQDEQQAFDDKIQKQKDGEKDRHDAAIQSIQDEHDQKVQAIQDELQTSLDAINQEKQAAQDAEQQEMSDLQDAHQQKLQMIQDELQSQLDSIQQTKDAQDSAINDQIQALQDKQNAQAAATKDQGYRTQIMNIQGRLQRAKTPQERAAIERELYLKQAEYQNFLDQQATNQKVAQLKEQEKAVNADAAAKTKAAQESAKAQTAAENQAFKEQQKALQDSLKQLIQALDNQAKAKQEQAKDDTKAADDQYKQKKKQEDDLYSLTDQRLTKEKQAMDKHFQELLKQDNLNAQARKLILNKNNKEITALLKTYNPDWLNAGKSFGDQLVDGLQGKIPNLQATVSQIEGMVAKAKADIASIGTTNAQLDKTNTTLFNQTHPLAGTTTKRISANVTIPKPKMMATGGIVKQATFAIVGEAGPEAVVPLNKMNGGLGGTQNVFQLNFHGPVYGIEDFEKKVTDVAEKAVVPALAKQIRQPARAF